MAILWEIQEPRNIVFKSLHLCVFMIYFFQKEVISNL